MMTDSGLTLYVTDGCGYCADVRAVLSELKLEIAERDAWNDPEARQELLAARGRRTVPVLRIDGSEGTQWMGESSVIIDYLYRRFAPDRRRPRWRVWVGHRGSMMAMWGLLLFGAVTSEPWTSVLWGSACSLAAIRSTVLAFSSRSWIHWAVASAFLSGAISIILSGLDIAELPWWNFAFFVAVATGIGTWVNSRRAKSSAPGP